MQPIQITSCHTENMSVWIHVSKKKFQNITNKQKSIYLYVVTGVFWYKLSLIYKLKSISLYEVTGFFWYKLSLIFKLKSMYLCVVKGVFWYILPLI